VLLGLTAPASADNIQEADKLFAEGIALRDTNLQQSCDKFAQSLKLNAQAIGTLMNVALCDEKLGRIASAVDHFSEARDRAKEGNLPEYLAEAQKHIDQLQPDVPFVVVKLSASPDKDTTSVLINDRVLDVTKILAGDKFPVDPGELHIVVTAKDRLPYRGVVLINKKETKSIVVPELEKSVTVKSSRRTIGIITTASGGALVAAGVVIGLVARSRYNGAFDGAMPDCDKATKICNPDGHSTTESAITLGWVGTGVGAVGVATVGVGLFLWLTAPKDKELDARQTAIIPTVTHDSAGLSAVGRF
jgi:hypothetical protein